MFIRARRRQPRSSISRPICAGVFNFIGIEPEFVVAEGLGISPEQRETAIRAGAGRNRPAGGLIMATASVHAPAADSASGAVTSPDAIALVGRILIAAIFVLSGASKITQPAATIAYMTAAGLPVAPIGLVVAALIELGGGIGLILGYRTRLAASALARLRWSPRSCSIPTSRIRTSSSISSRMSRWRAVFCRSRPSARAD